MGWAIHLHLIAAISWIGGAVFLFILGISLRDKRDQQEVYPRIGPIYGYFEIVALIMLIASGVILILNNGLASILFDTAIENNVIHALRYKLVLVAIVTVMTIVHTVISFRTIHKEKTFLEKIFSRASSMGIFLLNFIILHYAIILRDTL